MELFAGRAPEAGEIRSFLALSAPHVCLSEGGWLPVPSSREDGVSAAKGFHVGRRLRRLSQRFPPLSWQAHPFSKMQKITNRWEKRAGVP